VREHSKSELERGFNMSKVSLMHSQVQKGDVIFGFELEKNLLMTFK
jgi:hypothetical protein